VWSLGPPLQASQVPEREAERGDRLASRKHLSGPLFNDLAGWRFALRDEADEVDDIACAGGSHASRV
jgi:hypothetical protein